jgi:hypothetical protein
MAEFEKRSKRYPTDLTAEEWLFIQPFLPPVANELFSGGLGWVVSHGVV